MVETHLLLVSAPLTQLSVCLCVCVVLYEERIGKEMAKGSMEHSSAPSHGVSGRSEFGAFRGSPSFNCHDRPMALRKSSS